MWPNFALTFIYLGLVLKYQDKIGTIKQKKIKTQFCC